MRYLVVPLIASLLLPFTASAKTTVDIYHAEVALTQEKNANAIAWREGLEQVLVKASGDANIASNPVIQKALRDGSDYLSKFEYSTLNGEKSLDMQYTPKQIRALLSQADAAYWPQERENVLVWLVQDDNVERKIGWEQSGLESVSALQLAAQQSGLPVTLPVGDMDDFTKISAPDLWGNFLEPLAVASTRYPADSVLVLKVSANGDNSEVNWQLYDMSPEKMVTSAQPPISGAETGSLEQSIDHAVDKVSAYYAQKNKPSSEGLVAEDVLWANFSGVDSARSFFNLERSLLALESVATIQVHSIQNSNVVFHVELLSDEVDFEKQVKSITGIEVAQPPVDPAIVAQQAAAQEVTEPVEEITPENAEPGVSEGEAMEPVVSSESAQDANTQLWYKLHQSN